ncbi:class I SAM-dependent methyltransferase [Frankia sp. AgB32]|uniref:class I SAM-dependent methyltransferase n=1 Tax=Frankia sp. AgB32 TaxID=631119 RepID=UPI002010465B|nr:class I SAM-dependent methyltransferase [Frankia sp. AgB32]MCK9894006.1 class I SAM-dependent methyltransferase [Frankia sp. AgB32]
MDEIVRANLSTFAAGVADGYLAQPYHARRITEAAELLLREARRLSAEPRLADLGAGSDAVSAMLSRRGARVTMVDLVADPARSDRASLPLVRADLSRPLPFRDAVLDGLFAGELIEHLFDPLGFLLECRRALVPGGVLVVTTPNLATLQDRVRFLFGRSPRQVDPGHPYLRLHIRPFTYSALVRAFRDCGITPIEFRSNYCVLGGARRAVRSRALARLFPSLGGSLILAGTTSPGRL